MEYFSDDFLTDIPSKTAAKTPFYCLQHFLPLLSHYNLRKFIIIQLAISNITPHSSPSSPQNIHNFSVAS
jgi:hypothetical protein